MRVRSIFFFIIMFSCSVMLPAVAGNHEQSSIQQVTDLRLESSLSKGKKVILLMFSSESCEYCQFVRETYLMPLQKDPAYKDKLLVREVLREDYTFLYDFEGKSIDGGTLALRYDIDVTPTLIFMDHQGRELSKRIVGITLLDYLDMFIDQAIKESITKLN